MFCPRCGTQNVDSAMFCLSCGAPIVAGAQAPAYQPQQQGGQQTVRRAPAAEGNMGAAWRDITASDGWLKKVVLLLLIGCVPILNFAVEGYGIRWARDLSFGQRAGLPDTVFKKKEISTGFFAWLVRIGLGVAYLMVAVVITLLISGLFGMFNAGAGAVAATVFVVAFGVFGFFFYGPVVEACVMRMAVAGYLEAGFNFSTAWHAFRRNMGGLMGAAIVPRLLVGVIEVIVVAIISFIGGLIIGMGAYSAAGNPAAFLNYGMNSPQAFLNMVGGFGFGYLFLQVLTAIVSSMFNVFSLLFADRAVGHWVARTAPEWAGESDDGLDSANAGGYGFSSLVPDAPVQPSMPRGNADDA